MKKNNTHRTPEYAGWGALDGIDLTKDIEQLEHIEHDLEKLKQALYHEKRVLNHAYHEEEHESVPDKPDDMQASNRKQLTQIDKQELVGQFHKKLVEEVIAFCDEIEICPRAMSLNIDMLDIAIEYGCWTAATDSALVFSEDDKFKNIMYESL